MATFQRAGPECFAAEERMFPLESCDVDIPPAGRPANSCQVLRIAVTSIVQHTDGQTGLIGTLLGTDRGGRELGGLCGAIGGGVEDQGVSLIALTLPQGCGYSVVSMSRLDWEKKAQRPSWPACQVRGHRCV